MRRLPADPLGIRRRSRSAARQPERAQGHAPAPRPVTAAVRRTAAVTSGLPAWRYNQITHASDHRSRRRRRRHDRSAQIAGPGSLRSGEDGAGSRSRHQNDGDSGRARDRRCGGDGHCPRNAQKQDDRHSEVRR